MIHIVPFFFAIASATVIQDLCYTSDCDIPGIRPLKFVSRFNENATATSYTDVDAGQLANFSTNHNNTPMVVTRFDAEALRDTLTAVLNSSTGPDVMYWQRILFDYALDVTDLAISHNWNTSYPASMRDKVMRNGRWYGLPDRYTFWAFAFHPSIFAKYGLVPPRTFPEFLQVCHVLKANGIIPIGMGVSDRWQPLMLYTYIAIRVGGPDWWAQVLDNKVSYTDPIALEVLYYYQQLLEFLPDSVTMAKMGLAQVLGGWVTGKYGMVLMSQTAYSVGNSSDNDYFQFPIIKDVPIAEVSSYTVCFIPKTAKNAPGAKEWLKYASSSTFAYEQLGTRGGHRPANLAVEGISKPIVAKGYKMLEEAAYVFTPTDVALPELAGPSAGPFKKALCDFVSGIITATTCSNIMEQLRVTISLKTVSTPTISYMSGTYDKELKVVLNSPTSNASIQYMLTSVRFPSATYITYTTPLMLSVGDTYRLYTFAAGENLRNSPTVAATYTIMDVSARTPGEVATVVLSPVVIFAYVAIIPNSIASILILEHLRDNKAVKLWLWLGWLIRVIGCTWTCALIVYSSISPPTGFLPLVYTTNFLISLGTSALFNGLLMYLAAGEKQLVMVVNASHTSTTTTSTSSEGGTVCGHRFAYFVGGGLLWLDTFAIQLIVRLTLNDSEQSSTIWLVTSVIALPFYVKCWSYIVKRNKAIKRFLAASTIGIVTALQFTLDAMNYKLIYTDNLSSGLSTTTLSAIGYLLAASILIVSMGINTIASRTSRASLDDYLRELQEELALITMTNASLTKQIGLHKILNQKARALFPIRSQYIEAVTSPILRPQTTDIVPPGTVEEIHIPIETTRSSISRHKYDYKAHSLAEMIDHPVAYLVVVHVFTERHALELLSFYVDAKRYKEQPTKEFFNAIYHTYIVNPRASTINIGGEMKQKICQQLTNPTTTSLDEAQLEVYKVMVTNCETILRDNATLQMAMGLSVPT